jgi:nanoRNase/pAp phosphatase (c-di-AMP/oligoRNAs hydrolase)
MTITPKDQAIALIRRADKILCLSKAEAGADGIAAVLAFQALGQKLGKEVVAVLPHGVSHNLRFLPGHENIEKDLGEPGDFVISLSTIKSHVERVKYTIEEDSVDILITPKDGSFSPADVTFRHNAAHFDLIVILDCPTLDALGPVFSDHTELFANAPTLSISANPATADYAKVNLVDATKSSSCEILFDCIQHDKEYLSKMDADLATSLLTGMVASTGSFLRPNTTASSLEAAALLQSIGAEQSDIIEHLFKQKSFNTLKVWGRIFSMLELDPVHRFAWAQITQTDLNQLEANSKDADNITAEILRYTDDIDIAALILEEETGTVVQLRSKNLNLQWDDVFEGKHIKVVEHGINITSDERNASKVTEQILQTLSQWQKKRLQIPADTAITKLKAATPSTQAPALQAEIVKIKKPVLATPPAEFPFSVPGKKTVIKNLMPNEPSVPPGTEAAEVIIEAPEKGIPEWLKKSFPSN